MLKLPIYMFQNNTLFIYLHTALFGKVYRTIFQVRDDDLFSKKGHYDIRNDTYKKSIWKYFQVYIYLCILIFVMKLKHNMIFFCDFEIEGSCTLSWNTLYMYIHRELEQRSRRSGVYLWNRTIYVCIVSPKTYFLIMDTYFVVRP